MKGNFKLKVSILLLFFSFCCIKSTWAQELNCGTKIKLISSTSGNGTTDGRIEAQVEGTGRFEAKLFAVSAKGNSFVKATEGSNSVAIVFEGLEDGNYKILVEYAEGKDPMCQFLQIAGITIKRQ
jgi:hypothetical protein